MTNTSYATSVITDCGHGNYIINNAIRPLFVLFSFALSHATTQKFRYHAKLFQVLFSPILIQCPFRLLFVWCCLLANHSASLRV